MVHCSYGSIWLRFRDMTRDRQTDRQTDRHPQRFMIWPHVVGHITIGSCRPSAVISYQAYAASQQSYSEALDKSGLNRQDTRREEITKQIFRQIKSPTHPLHYLIPPPKVSSSQMILRSTYPYPIPKCKKTRYGKDFIPYCIARKY